MNTVLSPITDTMKLFLIALSLLGVPTLTFGGGHVDCGTQRCLVTISGEITRDTLVGLDQVTGDKPIIVNLNSLGGDVISAMQIANLLRKVGPYIASVDKDASCLSSCVFVLAGAGRRWIYGKVGIHRPYSNNAQVDRSVDDIRTEQKRIEGIAKEFFSAVNVNPALYDEMMRTPPHQIKLLSSAQLEEYGLGEKGYDVEQSDNERQAKDIGITMGELLKRKAEAEKRCRDENCKLAHVIGISEKELKRRQDVGMKLCPKKSNLNEALSCARDYLYNRRK